MDRGVTVPGPYRQAALGTVLDGGPCGFGRPAAAGDRGLRIVPRGVQRTWNSLPISVLTGVKVQR